VKRYIMLAILFLICTVTLGWLIGDMAVHMGTGEPVQVARRSSIDCIMLTVNPGLLSCKDK
jgi:hypothetical protein